LKGKMAKITLKGNPANTYRALQVKERESCGAEMTDGPFERLYARDIVITDENGTVKYSLLVPGIARKPDYNAALKAL